MGNPPGLRLHASPGCPTDAVQTRNLREMHLTPS